jgi:hypothetical protein
VRWQAIDGSSDIKHPFAMATLCSKKWFHSNANQNELAIYSLQCILFDVLHTSQLECSFNSSQNTMYWFLMVTI